MRKIRFLAEANLREVDLPLVASAACTIRGPEAKHAAQVLRLVSGVCVEIQFPDLQQTWHAQINSLSSSAIELTLLDLVITKDLPIVHLVCGLLRGPKNDYLIEKAVELGVTSISFFKGIRSQGEVSSDSRLPRFNRIAQAALKQSGGSLIPQIAIYDSLAAALKTLHPNSQPRLSLAQRQTLDSSPAEIRLFCSEYSRTMLVGETQRQVTEINRQINRFGSNQYNLEKFSNPADIKSTEIQSTGNDLLQTFIVIGPEGGLTAEEEAQGCEGFGYKQVLLGFKTLRAETAAVVACGTLLQILSEAMLDSNALSKV
ncbi:RsmE family RNA methyltransferase [bacterium]|nr:RsmE family RNA methyltransferase [bacterium]